MSGMTKDEAARLILDIYQFPLERRVAIRLWEEGFKAKDINGMAMSRNLVGDLMFIERLGLEAFVETQPILTTNPLELSLEEAKEYAQRC